MSPITMFTNLVLGRQLLKCHAVTTLPFNSLAAAATKKQDGKNVLPIISA